ncbi:glycosyltransferase family 31 protein [Zasmidium cellare ATCC 36951]|uniref:N-acetylgalactosaminide beta-1,3-galactosyltransferase n=1 Tax=Zasmidium cellare ATCC 36951 TaxID=1080233 RepID=A0A6A6C023_ZASCE|nr:glycosyltransferase family 31 protein [Zasmidium cellare ATCC 36951]KAF2159490.1 glycosyltransferase family 31 protein [Zasmidium cellare ATCC 36951]
MTSMMYNDKARFASLERTPSGRPTPKLRRRVPQRTVCLLALPGADDVVVILKTGSTELRDKLPVHLNTTLRCYPHYLIFSDYEETYKSEHIYDALEFVNSSIRHTHPDFELWRRLQKGGRAALKPHELSGPISRPQKDAMGKPSNPGWKLDKWKFLPMVNRTLHEYPDKKWYIFVETDTYVMWQTLLNYLHALNAEKPYYIGGQIWIADVQFAHGGTGFAVSHPAMKNVVDMYQAEQTAWEKFTNDHWAGDCVLGKAFKDSGTNLTEAWPIWQGDDAGKMEFSRKDGPGEGYRLWCMPSVSYHHLGPTVVEELWRFEQDWMSRPAKMPPKTLRHKDVFDGYVLPRISKARLDWYNHADEDRGPVPSLEVCADICEADAACLQYALSTDFRCLSSSKPNLGEYSRGMESGWMVNRIEKWADKMEPCPKGANWIT